MTTYNQQGPEVPHRPFDPEPTPGGRFAILRKENPVFFPELIGPTAYPALPASSPWASDPTGVEPSLGYSIQDQEPVGEQFEIAASLDPSQATARCAHCGATYRLIDAPSPFCSRDCAERTITLATPVYRPDGTLAQGPNVKAEAILLANPGLHERLAQLFTQSKLPGEPGNIRRRV